MLKLSVASGSRCRRATHKNIPPENEFATPINFLLFVKKVNLRGTNPNKNEIVNKKIIMPNL